jgi:TrmH RNA methyltransferase
MPQHLRRDLAPSRSGEVKVSGLESCRALFARRPAAIHRVVLLPHRVTELVDLVTWCEAHGRRYELAELDALSRFAETVHHDGICIVAEKKSSLPVGDFFAALERRAEPMALLLLEGIKNPNNVGAIARACAYFDSPYLLAAGATVGFTLAAMRTAQGGAEAVDLVNAGDGVSCLTGLKRRGHTVIATSSHAASLLSATPLPPRCVLLLGGENAGLSPSLTVLADATVAIPGAGHLESLNVGATAAVLLWEHWRQHRAADARPAPRSTASARPERVVASIPASTPPAPRPRPPKSGRTHDMRRKSRPR